MQTPGPDDRASEGFSGVKVVLVVLGSIAVVFAFVLIGFTLFEPESAPCASGEMATNQLVDGRFQPRTETFDAVDDAEAFICRGVPELQADGWSLVRIEAMRTVPLEYLVEGDGVGVVTLGYEDASGRSLTIDAAPFFGPSYFESQVPAQHTAEDVLIEGIPARVYRLGINPDQVQVIWQDDSLEQRATVQLDDEFTLDNLLEVLATLE